MNKQNISVMINEVTNFHGKAQFRMIHLTILAEERAHKVLNCHQQIYWFVFNVLR